MRRTLLLLLSFLACVAWGQTYRYRYWLDNNVGGAVSGSATGEKQLTISLSSVGYGLHAIHVQGRNSAGVWSSVRTRYFLKEKSDQTCTSARYWIDNDMTTLHNSVATSGVIELDIAGLEYGLHAVHYQKIGTDGIPSAVRTRYFLKEEENLTCTSARYWIDNDMTTLHNSVATSGVIELDIANLDYGLHAVHYQKMGADGIPSAVRTRYFLKEEENLTCTSARYWIDNDMTTLHSSVATSGIIDIDITKQGVGLHAVHYQKIGTDGTPSAVRTRYFLVDRLQKGSLTADISIDDGVATTYALSDDDIVIDISELEEGTHTLAVKLLDTKGHIIAEQTNDFEYGPFVVTGDTNGDGTINGTDLVALVNMILGLQEANSAADVNGDGEVNGTDYVALVDVVLNATNTQNVAAEARQMNDTRTVVSAEQISARNGCAVSVALSNPGMDVTLLQLDMMLPQGLSLKSTDDEHDIVMAGRTTWKSHSLYVGELGDNTLRLLLASGKNALIAGHDGAVLKLHFEADSSFEGGDIVFNNILCTTPDQKESKPLPLCLPLSKGSFTAISEMTSDSSAGTIYSLSGQKLSRTQKGVNIVGGKKKMVK